MKLTKLLAKCSLFTHPAVRVPHYHSFGVFSPAISWLLNALLCSPTINWLCLCAAWCWADNVLWVFFFSKHTCLLWLRMTPWEWWERATAVKPGKWWAKTHTQLHKVKGEWKIQVTSLSRLITTSGYFHAVALELVTVTFHMEIWWKNID